MHPQAEQEFIFYEIGEIGMVGVDNLACVLRATTKKRSSAFWVQKSAPPEKIPATLTVEWW